MRAWNRLPFPLPQIQRFASAGWFGANKSPSIIPLAVFYFYFFFYVLGLDFVVYIFSWYSTIISVEYYGFPWQLVQCGIHRCIIIRLSNEGKHFVVVDWAWLLLPLPLPQYGPLNSAVHTQRYPFCVKPVWQDAMFWHEFCKHAFWAANDKIDSIISSVQAKNGFKVCFIVYCANRSAPFYLYTIVFRPKMGSSFSFYLTSIPR